ncbi:MAG TPA: cytochrome c biogenesis protein CcdA [Candidatus Gracilibacteria bacterium]
MDFITLGLAFIFGILTILAPCVFPLLPIIIGGSLKDQNPLRPWIVTGSLMVSIVVFSLLLQGLSLALQIDGQWIKNISGGIVIFFGLILLFPQIWQQIMSKLGSQQKSEELLQKAGTRSGYTGMILTGAALGPVFTSCSPTYGLIIAIILPVSFIAGVIYLLAYAFGLALVMGIIAYFGQRAIKNMRWAANPNGWFKKTLGILFIIVGLAIIYGYDKKFEAFFIEKGWYIDTLEFEEKAVEKIEGRLDLDR